MQVDPLELAKRFSRKIGWVWSDMRARDAAEIIAEALIRREEGAEVECATVCPKCYDKFPENRTKYVYAPCCGTRLKWPKEPA